MIAKIEIISGLDYLQIYIQVAFLRSAPVMDASAVSEHLALRQHPPLYHGLNQERAWMSSFTFLSLLLNKAVVTFLIISYLYSSTHFNLGHK